MEEEVEIQPQDLPEAADELDCLEKEKIFKPVKKNRKKKKAKGTTFEECKEQVQLAHQTAEEKLGGFLKKRQILDEIKGLLL